MKPVSERQVRARIRIGMTEEEARSRPLRRVDMDVIGEVRGRLTILRYVGRNAHGNVLWDCSCACGTSSVIVSDAKTKDGHTSSCGCVKREKLRERNRAQKQLIELDGVRHTIASLASAHGMSWQTLQHRLRARGMTPEQAVATPIGPSGIRSILPPLGKRETAVAYLSKRSPTQRNEDAADFERWRARIAPLVEAEMKRRWESTATQRAPLAREIASIPAPASNASAGQREPAMAYVADHRQMHPTRGASDRHPL